MRRSHRLIAAAVLVALSAALAGCSGGLSSFDPTDMLDWLDSKKKLPGERKPVFPEGVPGLEQGVPKDLYKGARGQQEQQNAEAAAAASAAPAEPPNAKQAKSKSRGKQAATTASTAPAEQQAAPDAEAAPEEDGTPAAPSPPKPKKIARKRTTRHAPLRHRGGGTDRTPHPALPPVGSALGNPRAGRARGDARPAHRRAAHA